MGITFDGDKLYFDELAKGISTGLSHDDGLNWDALSASVVSIVLDLSLGVEAYYNTEILDVNMVLGVDADENYAKFVDLMQYVPLKFRDSTVLQEFIDEIGLETGSWIGYINDIEKLLDKYSVSDTYIQNLADLVGYTIIGDQDTLTIAEKRRQLIQVIDWYKMKGTYAVYSYISYLLSLTLNFWDMYTNDYVTFVKEEWYVGDSETDNPGGLGVDYYKSPHFGFEIVLDTVYGVDPDKHLFEVATHTDLAEYVELVRPVNTVPHYYLLLPATCYETGTAYEMDGEILTCTIGSWAFTKNYFDDGLNFDDGEFFDYSRDTFLDSIDKWSLGTGNKGVSPDTSGFALATPVLSGSITTTTISSNKTEYEFEVTGSTQQGISELGLFLTDGTTLEVASTFPDIDLAAALTLRVVVTVYR